MIQFKICMIGAFAVGKTSLVERYVRSLYSDEYHTTIGVKIDKKNLTVDGTDVTCMLWDIAGEDEFYTVNNNYLRGMSGYFLVIDGTRRSSLKIATRIQQRIELLFPDVPFVLLANKHDLRSEWLIESDDVKGLSDRSYEYLTSSAKTGDNVNFAFKTLVRKMLEARTAGSSNGS